MNALNWIVSHGGDFLLWALIFIGTWLAKIIRDKVTHSAIIQRALDEIGHAILEVATTYVDAIKEASKDGKLTSDEASLAKSKALEIAKQNIGTKGLAMLGRILGVESVDKWISSKIESGVAVLNPERYETVEGPFPPSGK